MNINERYKESFQQRTGIDIVDLWNKSTQDPSQMIINLLLTLCNQGQLHPMDVVRIIQGLK